MVGQTTKNPHLHMGSPGLAHSTHRSRSPGPVNGSANLDGDVADDGGDHFF